MSLQVPVPISYLGVDGNEIPVTVAKPLPVTGGGGGGGGGDASAANQVTQIAAEQATQTSVSSIDAKMPASPATSGKQDTGNTSLATIATNTGRLPAQGAAAGAAALPIVTATDDAIQGPTNETAPATDTASSGHNGRLQRIAQRLTALIAQLPATLGIKTSALSLSIAPSSDGTFLVAGATATRTNQSGTIATGGTAQTAIASNAARKGFEIQNQSVGNLYFSTLAAAVPSQPSILLVPGAFYETPLGGAGTGAVSIVGATTGQAFAAREWT